MIAKKGLLPLCILILGLPGCWGKKKSHMKNDKHKKNQMVSQANTPATANKSSVRNFFDDDVEEFIAATQEEADAIAKSETSAAKIEKDFSWDDTDKAKNEPFDVVYFDFDRYTVREDQRSRVEFDIEQARQELAKADATGTAVNLVVEGHACHSAGSSVYNLALSEQRAKVVSDSFSNAGISRERIKVVGRGSEVPAIIDGKPVDGDRTQQWPNRRVEVHVNTVA